MLNNKTETTGKLLRPVNFHFRATEEEAAAIRSRMAEIGVSDFGAYARKMLTDGLHVTLDLSEVREMVTLLKRVGTNVNQIARRTNETRSLYAEDVEDIRRRMDDVWAMARKTLEGLAKIK